MAEETRRPVAWLDARVRTSAILTDGFTRGVSTGTSSTGGTVPGGARPHVREARPVVWVRASARMGGGAVETRPVGESAGQARKRRRRERRRRGE